MPRLSFTAEPYRINDRVIVRLPSSISAHLPSRGQVMVSGTVNGVAFSLPLEPDGKSGHWFELSPDIRQDSGARTGKPAYISVEPIKQWPEPILPADWEAAIASDTELQALWLSVTPMARHEWLRWINSTAQADTRKRRIEVSISKLKNGERRPCCFNRNMCCVPDVSRNGVLLEPAGS